MYNTKFYYKNEHKKKFIYTFNLYQNCTEYRVGIRVFCYFHKNLTPDKTDAHLLFWTLFFWDLVLSLPKGVPVPYLENIFKTPHFGWFSLNTAYKARCAAHAILFVRSLFVSTRSYWLHYNYIRKKLYKTYLIITR